MCYFVIIFIIFFTQGRYNPSGDIKIRGELVLEWLVFTDGLLVAMVKSDNIEALDGHR